MIQLTERASVQVLMSALHGLIWLSSSVARSHCRNGYLTKQPNGIHNCFKVLWQMGSKGKKWMFVAYNAPNSGFSFISLSRLKKHWAEDRMSILEAVDLLQTVS